jgi:hypothetical protein
VPTLLVACHRCGLPFPSEPTMSERGMRGRFLEGSVYECPHCGTRDPYFSSERRLSNSGGFADSPSLHAGPFRTLYSRLTGLRRFVP